MWGGGGGGTTPKSNNNSVPKPTPPLKPPIQITQPHKPRQTQPTSTRWRGKLDRQGGGEIGEVEARLARWR